MIVSLATAAETMSSHNDTHSLRLKEFTEQLHQTARGTDLSQMKRDLNRQVEVLTSTAHSICTVVRIVTPFRSWNRS